MAQTSAPTGFSFGGNAQLIPFSYADPLKKSLELSAYDGGMVLYSGLQESVRGNFDGGITLYGNPVSILLETPSGPVANQGAFNVWKSSTYWNGGVNSKPLFKIESASEVAIFESADVTINEGSLTVSGDIFTGGAKVASQAYATSAINSKLNSALALSGGNVTGEMATAMSGGSAGAYHAVAMNDSFADGMNSAAMGESFAVGNASVALAGSYSDGAFSVALSGGNSIGAFTTALSGGSAEGENSIAGGKGIVAKAYASTALGAWNTIQTGWPASWVESDPLFTIGNGSGNSTRSNAMMMLKNGQTTFRNKFWSGSTPSVVPGGAAASSGNAVVVEGHSVLKGNTTVEGNTLLQGNVIIAAPQGDISMGIYQ